MHTIWTLRLEITPEPGGGWQLAVGDGQGSPGRATATASDVQGILQDVEQALGSMPVVVLRGRDADRSQAERAAGRALARVFRADVIGRALARAQGRVEALGEVLVLIVDSADPGVRRLPWELLADREDGAPLEELGAGIVVRLAGPPGYWAGPGPAALGTRILTWCPTPDDEACRSVLDGLDDVVQRRPGLRLVRLDDRSARLPALEPGWADVLHLVCHGRMAAREGVLVAGPGKEHAVGTAAHLLSKGLEGVALVVLDVCHGGSPTADQLANLAGSLLAAGAGACVAPERAAHVDALVAFSRGLHRALGVGAPLASAVAAGRTEVRALVDPHPDARWCNHRLLLTSVEAAGASPVRTGWLPTRWPSAAPGSAVLMDRARALAVDSGCGHLGLEHLALALADLEPIPRELHRLRDTLPSFSDPRWRSLSRGLEAPGHEGDELELTPRLVVLGVGLPDGFAPVDLWRCVAADPHHGLHLLAPPDWAEALQVPSDSWTDSTLARTRERASVDGGGDASRARAVQVVWGPEDGRVLILQPGDTLGRWAPGASSACSLYEGKHSVDRYLHRRQLIWLGEGRVRLLVPTRHWRGGVETSLEAGEVALLAGDLLQLSYATWLRALGVDSA